MMGTAFIGYDILNFGVMAFAINLLCLQQLAMVIPGVRGLTLFDGVLVINSALLTMEILMSRVVAAIALPWHMPCACSMCCILYAYRINKSIPALHIIE